MMLRVVFVAAALMLTPCGVHAGSADDEDSSCAIDNGASRPVVSRSLLQKATHQDVKSFIAQEPPEAPVITNCTGFAAQGRCWLLSETGETCVTTCSKRGRSFSYAISSSEEPLTPKLLDHEPRTKQEPWAALECYVPSEDRYHPANENAAKHVDDNIGNWSDANCKLACPCGGKASDSARCSWKPPSTCAETFKWDGVEYSGCATADKEHEQPWCQFNYTQKDTKDWSYCDYSCGPEAPSTPKPPASTTVAPSSSKPPAAVTEEPPSPKPPASTTAEPTSPKPPAAKREKVCYWLPNPDCQESFQYKGVEYIGCTGQDHPTPWCSRDRVHRGFFEKCTWACNPEKPEGPEDEEPEEPEDPDEPEQPEQPQTCARSPDPKRDFIGNSVTLDEVGYTIVRHVPSADSPMNMKAFVCRVVDEMGCRVNNSSQALMAFGPLHRNDTYSVLKNELQSLCKAGDGWVVPQSEEAPASPNSPAPKPQEAPSPKPPASTTEEPPSALQRALAFVKVAQVLDGVKEA